METKKRKLAKTLTALIELLKTWSGLPIYITENEVIGVACGFKLRRSLFLLSQF